MKEINQKKLLEEILSIESLANVLAKKCNDLRKRLDDTGEIKKAKQSQKKLLQDAQVPTFLAQKNKRLQEYKIR